MNIQNLIDRVKKHAAETGKTPKSVLRSATGNAHAWARLLRLKDRAEAIDQQVEDHIQASASGSSENRTEAAE